MTEKSFFAGFGGQGIISLGQIWVYCGMAQGKNVSFYPFYGAEKRGGVARANVILSDDDIASPLVTYADSALAMNGESLPICEKTVKPGGLLVVNSSIIKESVGRKDIRVVLLDAQGLAEGVGEARSANMVALGAMAKLTGALDLSSIEAVLNNFFPESKRRFVPANVKAIEAGAAAV